jgi:hypothetical protein
MGGKDIFDSFPHLTGSWLKKSSKQAIVDKYGQEQGAVAIDALKAEYKLIYESEGRQSADAFAEKVNNNPLSYAAFVLEYQQIDWIGGGGTRYIITDYIPQGSTKIVLDAQFTNIKSLGWIYGSRGTNIFSLGINPVINYWIFGYKTDIGNDSFQIKPLDTDRHIFINDQGTYHIDDMVNKVHDKVSYTCQYPMGIFKSNGSGNVTACQGAKIYSMQVYEDNVLIKDYIPAKRMADNEVGLYDLAQGVFLTNSGSGTFDCP